MPVKDERFGELASCRVCNNDISSKAEVCPFCGERYRMHPVVKYFIFMMALSIIFYIFVTNQ